jgi:hypothetical protein
MKSDDNKNEEKEQQMNKEETDTEALIKPGYDYIWGSDQDDLTEEKQQ